VNEQADHELGPTPDEDAPSSPSVAPQTDPPLARRQFMRLRVVVDLCLLVLAILLGVGSFFSWFIQMVSGQAYPTKGIQDWRGYGWMTLVLAIVIVVVVVADLSQPSVTTRAVAAALFGASGVISVFFALQYVAFASTAQLPTSLGWGLDLCMGVGVVGLGLGSFAAMLGRHSPQPAS